MGPHFMDQNVLVHVQGDVGKPLVFELTRNSHPPALLSDFPAIAVGKVGGQLGTEEGRAKAIGQLVAKHAGEVVDFDPNRTFWTLRLKSGPGAASSDSEPVHPQLFCVGGGSRSATATSASMAAGQWGFSST